MQIGFSKDARVDRNSRQSGPVGFVRERGAVLVLFGIFLLAFLAVLALAIDTVVFSTTKTDMQVRANQIALAALSGFYDSTKEVTSDRLNDALNVAKNEARFGQSVSGQGALYQNQAVLQNSLVLAPRENASARGANGRIIPGRWHRVEPTPNCASAASASTCPCGGGVWRGPCFETLASTEAPTAIRVEYNTDATSRVRTIVGSFLGRDSFGSSGVATATVNPRRAVFMFDLSRSVVSITHGAVSVAAAQPRDGYAFMVDPRFGMDTCSGAPDGSNVAFWTQVSPAAAPLPIRRLVQDDYIRYSGLAAADPAALANYRCVEVSNTADEGYNNPGLYGVPAAEESRWNNQLYLIDTARAPQPLTDILSGVHTALEEFKQRAVKGDMVGVMGFDDSTLASRATLSEPWSGQGDAYTVGLVRSDVSGAGSEFQKMLDATDMSLSLTTRLSNKFLIPRYYGSLVDSSETYPFNRSPAGSDLARMLEIALQMVLYGYQRTGLPANRQLWPRPSSAVMEADKFVFFMTDGIANCATLNTSTNAPTHSTANLELRERICNPGTSPWDSTNYFSEAMLEVQSVLGAYAFWNVPAYFVNFPASFARISGGALQTAQSLPGNRVMVDRWRGKNQKCVTEEAMSAYARAPLATVAICGGIRPVTSIEWGWTDGHCYSPVPAGPWGVHYPQALSVNAIATGGAYYPIRPPCNYDIAGVPCSVHRQLPSVLDAQCKAIAGAADNCGGDASTPYLGIPFLDSIDPTHTGVCAGFNVHTSGNLWCDPLCRSRDEQILDPVNSLMKNNPYILVE